MLAYIKLDDDFQLVSMSSVPFIEGTINEDTGLIEGEVAEEIEITDEQFEQGFSPEYIPTWNDAELVPVLNPDIATAVAAEADRLAAIEALRPKLEDDSITTNEMHDLFLLLIPPEIPS